MKKALFLGFVLGLIAYAHIPNHYEIDAFYQGTIKRHPDAFAIKAGVEKYPWEENEYDTGRDKISFVEPPYSIYIHIMPSSHPPKIEVKNISLENCGIHVDLLDHHFKNSDKSTGADSLFTSFTVENIIPCKAPVFVRYSIDMTTPSGEVKNISNTLKFAPFVEISHKGGIYYLVDNLLGSVLPEV